MNIDGCNKMGKLENLNELSRDELFQLARMSEQAERYDEMISFVRAFIKKEQRELTVDERNILSVAYKNVVGNRRTSWRVLNSIEQKEAKRGNDDNKQAAATYKEKVENELRSYCREILSLIDSDLMPTASNAEGRVFYLKMKGDYYRYICEFATGDFKDENAALGLQCYEEANKVSQAELDATNPTRLGLALNFSVFYYEIMNKPENACSMAKAAFDEAIPNLDNLTDETAYKDSTLILQLLRDNLTLWNSETEDN